MATSKPRKNVEAGLNAGRKSLGGTDGLGKIDDIDNFPEFKEDQPLKRNAGDVPDARRTTGAGNDRHGLNPAFDSDEPRKAPKSLGGGGNCERSPFSAAGKRFK